MERVRAESTHLEEMMSNQAEYEGLVPTTIFITETSDPAKFWVYLREGHAINRMLKERAAGRTARLIKYEQTLEQE